MAFNSEVL